MACHLVLSFVWQFLERRPVMVSPSPPLSLAWVTNVQKGQTSHRLRLAANRCDRTSSPWQVWRIFDEADEVLTRAVASRRVLRNPVQRGSATEP